MKRFFLTYLMVFFSISIANAGEPAALFHDWEVHEIEEKGVNYCYAYTTPYRTKAFSGIRDEPYFLIAYRGPKQYSIGVYSGYSLDATKGFIAKVNNRSYLLDVKMDDIAWTYTSIQDVAIINDMIEDGYSIQIRSYNKADEVAVDYYSLKGLVSTLNYFVNHCS